MSTDSSVVVFAPSPVLTVTVEDHPDGPDVHVHAGGQGVWQARMLLALGTPVTLCSALIGETGRVLAPLIAEEGIRLVGHDREGRGSVYVHDRRSGSREVVVEAEGDSLTRHDIDELYGLTLREGLAAGTAILSGPHGEDALPPDVYRRLAIDLRSNGTRVIVDLAGERLSAALSGGVDVAKVSDEELLEDNLIADKTTDAVLAAMHTLRRNGAGSVIVTRADQPALLLTETGAFEVHGPTMEVVDHRGAGDSLTAGVAATLAAGGSIEDAVVTGAAAGALNVTRHGLGTGDASSVEALRPRVTIRPLDQSADSGTKLTPHDLAGKVEEA